MDLKGLVQEIIQWAEQPPIQVEERRKKKGRRKRIYRTEIPCSLLDLRTIHKFVSIPGVVDSEIIAARMSENLRHNEVWDCRFNPHNFQKVSQVVASLLMDLKEAFRVPRLQRPDENCTLKRRGVIAGFVELLAKLLINKEDFSATGFDQVMKELRYLVNIFWDKPFQATEHMLVQSLLAQFEGLLNEAGRFVYSLVFLSDHHVGNRIDEALLESISFLKNNIIVFLSTMADLVASKAANYRDVDSFFIVESLVYDLEDLLSRSDARIVEMKDKIQLLHSTLMFSWSLVKDHLEVEESKEIATEIRGMAYEAECLINSFLVGHVPAWYLTINLSNIISRVDLIGTKIEEMKHNCDVEALKDEISSDAQLSQELGIGIEVDGTVVGIEKEEISILDQLVGGTENLQFICITGTPGLGKTTLAKKLFNNLSVGHQFDRRCWCVVSQMYMRKKVLSDIFNCLEDDAQMKADEQDVALQIYQALYGRRYLIVLDDMWDSDVWDDLQSCFPDDKNGSRILFTSRNRDAAPDGSIINALPFWSNNQCWELLEKKVFGNETCPPELQVIGKQIAANCKGLPLVVVAVASIVSMIDQEPRTWKVVARDIGSHIFSDQNTWVVQILKLSYKHLPKYLKPCFLCFGVFRKGTEIPVKKLVQLWIAEGFICIEKKRAEDIAEDYFMELVDKSLLTVSKKRSDGGAKACVIHDLLHDMCLRVAEEENFLKTTCDSYAMRMKVQAPLQLSQPYGPWLRSFYCDMTYEHLFVINMKLLRVLDCWAWRWNLSLHLVGLEHLANLRYLATRGVPKSIDSLVSLEYLIVDDSVHISSFILNLVKLRYLKAPKVFFDNCCISSQKDTLEFLSNIYIRSHNDIWLLKDYPQLRRLKCSFDMTFKGVSLRYLDLSFLHQLKSLSISSTVMICVIKLPCSIKKLTLDGFLFSGEMMSTLGALRNLKVLKLVNSKFMRKRWDTRDGQFQKLRFLKLDSVNLVHWNVAESGHFPILRQLVVQHCKFLTMIPDEIGDIMTLELIDVSGCPPSVGESAIQIQEQQDELGNEGLTVNVQK